MTDKQWTLVKLVFSIINVVLFTVFWTTGSKLAIIIATISSVALLICNVIVEKAKEKEKDDDL